MKLIRLQTDDDYAVFDNTFNAELKVSKGSKIALKNILLNKFFKTITITGHPDDNIGPLMFAGQNYGSTLLPDGTYTSANAVDLLANLEIGLNELLAFDDDITNNQFLRGTAFLVSLVDGKVNINIRLSRQNFRLAQDPVNGVPQPFMEKHALRTKVKFSDTGGVGAPQSHVFSDADDTTGGTNVKWDIPFTKGCGWFHAVINDINEVNPGAGNNGGFIIGFVNEAAKNALGSALNVSNYTIGIQARLVDGNEKYKYIENGVATETLTNVTQYDNVAIELTMGYLEAVRYDGVGAKTILGSMKYYYADLYPAITLYNQGNTPSVTTCTKLTQVFMTCGIQEMASIQTIDNAPYLSMERAAPSSNVNMTLLTKFGTTSNPYLSVATTGTTTQTDGHIDGSDPISQSLGGALPDSSDPTRSVYLLYYSINGAARLPGNHASLVGSIGINNKTYRHKEIEHTISGLQVDHVYQLDIVLEDMDEHNVAKTMTIGGGSASVLAYSHPTEDKYPLEDAKVYINGSEVGTISAVEGKGENQTVRKVFNGVTPDSNGVIKVEIALQFLYTSGGGADPAAQQGVRLHSIKVHRENGLGATAGEYPGSNQNGSTQELSFVISQKVASFLKLPFDPSIKGLKPLNITGNQDFDPTDKADNFVVEMLSMDLDSYDGVASERRSILATVPKAVDEDGTIVYDTPAPVFIDINNANDILIRNIRARLLKPNLEPLRISGNAYMTVLID